MNKIFTHHGHILLSGTNLEVPQVGQWVKIGGGKMRVESVEYDYDAGKITIKLE